MSIAITEIKRAFRYNGILLPDVPGLEPREVRDLYSAQYPELVSAEIEPGEVRDGTQEFTFRKAVGTKGTGEPVQPRTAALLARIGADESGAAGEPSGLSRALSRRDVAARSAAWSRFAHATLEQQRHGVSAHRTSATSDMLSPLP
ncbi:PRTRC system protein C [Methylibium sp.]|uniref:PRTRC system protein C n=1 Tax=Methylibium sp. TaxID=2067992 RepID=UPI003D0DFFD9